MYNFQEEEEEVEEIEDEIDGEVEEERDEAGDAEEEPPPIPTPRPRRNRRPPQWMTTGDYVGQFIQQVWQERDLRYKPIPAPRRLGHNKEGKFDQQRLLVNQMLSSYSDLLCQMFTANG